MIAALVRPAMLRLRRTRPMLALGAWTVLAVGFALAARSRGASHGADHVLVEALGALVLPLVAYTLVGAVVGPRSLAASCAPLVGFGAAPSRVASVTAAVALAWCVLAGSVLAAVVAIVAHGSSDPPLASDAIASAYAGALGGAAYGGWFVLGSSLGKRGGGRTVLLVVDWLFGLGQGVLALTTPRAHLRNLLGGAPPMGWPERASAAMLVAFALTCAALAVSRSRR